MAVASSDATGGLLEYDPRTRGVTVLIKVLSAAAGTEVSRDCSFV